MDLSSIARTIRFQQHPTLTACWVWTGGTYPDGRPRATHEGVQTTGRVAVYRTLRGDPPSPLKLACRESLCVNPNHMEAT